MEKVRNVQLTVEDSASEWIDKTCRARFQSAIGYATLWGLSYPRVRITVVSRGVGTDLEEAEIHCSYYADNESTKPVFFMAGIWHRDKDDFGFHS